MQADDQNLTEAEAEIVEEEAPPAEPEKGRNLPLILTLAALLAWHGFQTVQLLRERSQLSLAKESQDAALQESQKVQAQFQTLITKTSELAAQGHAGAKMVMEELQKRGVGVAPAPQPRTSEKPEAKVPQQSKAPEKPDIKNLK